MAARDEGRRVSRREQGKAERRRRIVAAARDLVRETGDTGLSMRALAARAGVAITTPYSLFGSKHGIVLAVLQDVLDFQQRFSRLPSSSAVERIFQAVALSLSYLAEDPALYRALWTEVLRSDSLELRSELSSPERYAFWHQLIAAAKAEGTVSDWIEIDPLLRSLDAVYVSAIIAWTLGHLPLDQVEARAGYGYALALRGAATSEGAATLEGYARRFQAALPSATAPVRVERSRET